MKIISAAITPMPRPMPLGMFDPMPGVIATFEGGSTKMLFSFSPDEVTFQAPEFTGLTEEEAHDLLQKWKPDGHLTIDVSQDPEGALVLDPRGHATVRTMAETPTPFPPRT